MPQLSVIVYGPNAQGHLTELLDSLEAHPLSDAEIVVAAVGDWARETAEGHAPDTVVVPLPDGTTDAAARAAGAARATGRWLHFVHAKDGLPAGAPRLIAERAAELDDSVDVLLLDHLTTTWQAAARPSRDGRFLAAVGRAALPLDEAVDLLRMTPLLGNRALRREFWAAHEERLTTDDEPRAARAALLCAGRVACLNQVAYENRELRPESLPPLTPEDRFELVERYEALMPLARDRRAPRVVLYDLMMRDLVRTFAGENLPDEVAREFFRRASLAAVRWRPERHEHPAGVEGVRHALLEEGAYTKYRAFQAANRARRAARKTVRARKRQVGAKLREQQYRRALTRPVDPDLAVFAAYWERGVACNPAAIAAKLAELAPHIHPVWVVAKDNTALLPPGTDHVVPGTRRYWEVLATAKYLVNNVNFPNAVVKRPDAIHLQTHHGTPLKRMGLDQIEHPAAAKGLDFDALLARIDRWDYSVSANSHSTRMWERAYPARYTSLDHGYPRNDVFYTSGAEAVRAARARLGIAPGKTAILYAPTHRDYEAGFTPRLDLAELADRLGEDTVLLVRAHYFYGGATSPLTGLRRSGRLIDVSSYDPVEELCLAADALVTDYSSIMFDYANLDRPIVVYADDWETYRTTRGVYFDLMTDHPGQVARTQEELTEIFRSGAWRDETAAKARTAFRRRFCEYDDGRAAERVVRRVFLGEPEDALPPVLPIEDRTPAPTPEEATA
ncbi:MULTISPECIES: CDP-glycerol glycerophosphotransferase family protein [unclassified Streptomyces]|uniref:CDP-glycerol glycerophosphotransferase family protein n=1 Tax=unclassified Streptomyces TaxID=2593676 RepID=UPI000DB9D7D0|nr:CDP-glycerol glycerophosphotransferase family protein [Streptomyces sp. PsTaAH-130]MYU03089.1 CDP-glycerol--poly(glycerophosphate) glycerophosphotransferase [Streptomyces sp. SID8366]MYU65670.1 CDP-glycerol--poly(glycerophosphate) glycerophosphotransferase [Streptomyces sp. SID69]RAJ56997.1 CDP-glycerol glycerophosphotransferase [Streptomyces sp. PsTaAH-130]